MENTAIWTEKYRPSKFEEVVGQDEIIKRVKNLTNSLNLPHMMFAGPAGTGKSTLAIIVAKNLFKKFLTSCRITSMPRASLAFNSR